MQTSNGSKSEIPVRRQAGAERALMYALVWIEQPIPGWRMASPAVRLVRIKQAGPWSGRRDRSDNRT
jgi:hypothetical protein